MKARPQRTDDELREASVHLMYEMDMLFATAKLLACGQYAGTAEEGALLESFAVHVRALLHCFYPPLPGTARIDDDDVLAADFFDEPGAWARIRPELPGELEGIRQRVNKELAHLTYTRNQIVGDAKTWPFMAIASGLLPTLRAFAHAVPAARLSRDRGWDRI